MNAADWLLEVVLIVLLGLTLIHAIRLERALGALRRDRSALGEAVAGFDSSARHAEAGLGRLHSMTQEAALEVARKMEGAVILKDDLAFLAERGEQLADRLEQLIRSGRALDPARVAEAGPGRADPPRSKAERDLLQALRVAR